MRSILHPLTRRAVSAPIETIVFFAIVGTLAYFQVLSAIKHSSFFAPSVPSAPRPAHALLRDGQWVGVDEEWYTKRVQTADSRPLELQQLIFSLDPAQASVAVSVLHLFSAVILILFLPGPCGLRTCRPRILITIY
jgi:hydroxymethylglutaryl-CoA reductase (NADPH)